MLKFVLENLKVDPIPSLNPPTTDYESMGVLRRFSQLDFLDTSIFRNSGLAEYGYLWYPNRCIDGSVNKCKIHMALPGCSQSHLAFGFQLVYNYGYVQYAATNDLIVLFPQMNWTPKNWINCVDVSGFTTLWSKDYMTNKGPQP